MNKRGELQMNAKKRCDDASKTLNWNESYSVGAPALDIQHKSLFEIINQLNTACAQDLGKKEMLAIIQKLYTYSATHFRDEEALLEKKQCSLLSDQQTHHAIFLDYVIELEQKVTRGVTHVDEEILTFLNTWWQEHILKIDKQYSKFF